jgi:hypothetical protein
VPNIKHFAERLNQCMDEIGAPVALRERAVILSKMLEIPKHQAWTLLEGHLTDESLIEKIAHEFEVDLKWLSGEDEK